LIKLYLPVGNLAEVLKRYDRIEVHRAVSRTGVFTEITTAATRAELKPGESLYTYYDENGATTSWYRSRYRNSASGATSDFSDPILGDEAEVLTHIMTVEDLKAIYLTGVDLTDDTGAPYPDIMFDFAIRAAIAWAETELDLDIRPTNQDEYQNYDHLNMQAWGHIQLNRYPVISDPADMTITLQWPSMTTPYEFPTAWLRVNKPHGIVNIVPTIGTLSMAMALQPYFAVQSGIVPMGLRIQYQSGFAYGALPADIRALIGMRACYPILNTAGDLIAGAGIASTSIGMDGLSQSVNTTSSATNAGYGARLIQFGKEIKEQIPVIKRRWKNVGLAMA